MDAKRLSVIGFMFSGMIGVIVAALSRFAFLKAVMVGFAMLMLVILGRLALASGGKPTGEDG